MGDPDSAKDGATFTNRADNSTVDNQIGYIEGDAVFHKHETIYQVNSDDSPAQKFTIARNNLAGGIPRVAEDLIGQVLDSTPATTEIAYYYALAVLSDRSLNQLGSKEFDELDRALKLAAMLPYDQWRSALDVIGLLLNCVLPSDRAPDERAGLLDIVVQRLEAIAHQRRAEITRHLDMIFDGATQDEVDRLNAQTVAEERTRGDRTNRAWKFFHPPPEAPRRVLASPLKNDQATFTAWAAAIVGLAAFTSIVVQGPRLLASWGLLAPPAAVFPLGILAAGWFGSLVLSMRMRVSMKADEERWWPAAPNDDDNDEDAGSARHQAVKFAALLRRHVDYYFARYRPEADGKTMDWDKWEGTTEDTRDALCRRLIRLYGTSRVPVARIAWLVRWHAKRAKQQWEDKEKLPDFRELLRPDTTVLISLGFGLVVAAGDAVWLVDAASRLGALALVLGIAAGIAGGMSGVGVTYLVALRLAMTGEQTELDQLFVDEQEGFHRWEERLADRPTDAEIGNWLDNDKSFLKTHAMLRCDLTNRDIIAHVVLAAGHPRARRARVRGGPPRYSVYTVLVFLLSENGVRQLEVDLNFGSGTIYHERRLSFRYDGLASTMVLEEGFQAAKGRRHLVRFDNTWHVTDKEALVLRRIFALTLVSGDSVKLEVDNYDGLLDEANTEDNTRLSQIARDSSGVAGALQILEAVAAEGREWIARERERRNRHWQEWNEWRATAVADPVEIGGSDRPLGIGQPQ